MQTKKRIEDLKLVECMYKPINKQIITFLHDNRSGKVNLYTV